MYWAQVGTAAVTEDSNRSAWKRAARPTTPGSLSRTQSPLACGQGTNRAPSSSVTVDPPTLLVPRAPPRTLAARLAINTALGRSYANPRPSHNRWMQSPHAKQMLRPNPSAPGSCVAAGEPLPCLGTDSVLGEAHSVGLATLSLPLHKHCTHPTPTPWAGHPVDVANSHTPSTPRNPSPSGGGTAGRLLSGKVARGLQGTQPPPNPSPPRTSYSFLARPQARVLSLRWLAGTHSAPPPPPPGHTPRFLPLLSAYLSGHPGGP